MQHFTNRRELVYGHVVLSFDAELLDSLGLGRLPDWEKNLLLRHVYEKLETRVGVTLSDRMTDAQRDEFEVLFDSNDDERAFGWLESNFPNYKDVVDAEFDKLKDELGAAAPAILEHSRRESQASAWDFRPAAALQLDAGEESAHAAMQCPSELSGRHAGR